MNYDDTLNQYLRMMHILGQSLTQEAGNGMGIEVGKIVLLDGVQSGRYATHREEQSVKVSVTTSGIGLYATGGGDGARDLLYANGNGSQLVVQPEQAIELAQLLLKAAEVQPEYAAEEKRLREEHEQLEAKYKSLLDGSRADDSVVVDVEDARSGFVLNKALS